MWGVWIVRHDALMFTREFSEKLHNKRVCQQRASRCWECLGVSVQTFEVTKTRANSATTTRLSSNTFIRWPRTPNNVQQGTICAYPAEQHLVEPLTEGDRQVLVAYHALQGPPGRFIVAFRRRGGARRNDKDEDGRRIKRTPNGPSTLQEYGMNTSKKSLPT